MKQQLLILILFVSSSLQGGVSDYTKNYSVEIHDIDILNAAGASVLT